MDLYNDITKFIFVQHEPEKADIIFVPGGSYPEPSEKAANLYKKGFAPYVMPSGKYSIKVGMFQGCKSKEKIYRGKYETEWDFMQDVLIRNGVDQKDILKENNAEYTYQNAIESRKACDLLNLEIKRAIICCKTFHARRSLMYYQYVFPQTKFMVCPAKTNDITSNNWFRTGEGVKNVFGEVERIGSQFVDLL